MSTRANNGARSETATLAATGAHTGVKTRLLYLDNLRTTAITLVVLGHVAVSYGAEGDWYLHGEDRASPLAFVLMLPLMAIGAALMMGLLFLIAGTFTPRSYDRHRSIPDRSAQAAGHPAPPLRHRHQPHHRIPN